MTTGRILTNGKTEEEMPDYRKPGPSGQQKSYVVLTEEERAKGFVRPYRSTYQHEKCGGVTTMSRPIAETYARDPKFYGATFCCNCGAHFPVAEFNWSDEDAKVGS